MAKFNVKWEEQSTTSTNCHPSRHATTVEASSMAEAKAKVKQRHLTSTKIINMTAVKIG